MEHFKFSDFLFCVSIICFGRIYYSACVQLAQFMCELAALPHENMGDLSFTWWQHTKLQILLFGLGTVCVCFKCGALIKEWVNRSVAGPGGCHYFIALFALSLMCSRLQCIKRVRRRRRRRGGVEERRRR